MELAADRWYRVARIYYARDELEKAAERLRYGVRLAEETNDLSVQNRYALLFHELSHAMKTPENELRNPTDTPALGSPATQPPTTSAAPPSSSP
jgi:hypothetical protein